MTIPQANDSTTLLFIPLLILLTHYECLSVAIVKSSVSPILWNLVLGRSLFQPAMSPTAPTPIKKLQPTLPDVSSPYKVPHRWDKTAKEKARPGLSKGPCKEEKSQKSEFTMEVGGWVQVSLGIFVVENQHPIAINQY